MNATKAVLAVGTGLTLLLVATVLVRKAPAEEPRPVPRVVSKSAEAAATPAAEAPEPRPAPERGSEAKVAVAPEKTADLASLRAQRREDREFWEDLGSLVELRPTLQPGAYREQVTSMTTSYLGLDRTRAAAFEQTTSQAIVQIGRAWKARDEAMLSLPAWVGGDDRLRKEAEIQGRYEEAKRVEMKRVEALLYSTTRQKEFRRKLGEWIDAVR